MRSDSALPPNLARIHAAEALVATARVFQRQLRALALGLPPAQQLELALLAEVGLHDGPPWGFAPSRGLVPHGCSAEDDVPVADLSELLAASDADVGGHDRGGAADSAADSAGDPGPAAVEPDAGAALDAALAQDATGAAEPEGLGLLAVGAAAAVGLAVADNDELGPVIEPTVDLEQEQEHDDEGAGDALGDFFAEEPEIAALLDDELRADAELDAEPAQAADAQDEAAQAEAAQAEAAQAEGVEAEGVEAESIEAESIEADAEDAQAEGVEAEGVEAEGVEAEGVEADAADDAALPGDAPGADAAHEAPAPEEGATAAVVDPIAAEAAASDAIAPEDGAAAAAAVAAVEGDGAFGEVDVPDSVFDEVDVFLPADDGLATALNPAPTAPADGDAFELRSEDIFGQRAVPHASADLSEAPSGGDAAEPAVDPGEVWADDDGLDAADDTIPGSGAARVGVQGFDAAALGLGLSVGLGGPPDDELDPDAAFRDAAGAPFLDADDPDDERTQLGLSAPPGGWDAIAAGAQLGEPGPAPVSDDDEEGATARVSLGDRLRQPILGLDPFAPEASSGDHTQQVSGAGPAEDSSAATAQTRQGAAPARRSEPDTADAFAALSMKMPSLASPQARELGSAPLGRETSSRVTPVVAREPSSERLRPEQRAEASSGQVEARSGRVEARSGSVARPRPPEIHSAPIGAAARRARPVDPWGAELGDGPRVVEGDSPAPEPLGAAAIQILGIGKARTLTQTLELEGTGEEPSEADAVEDAVEDGGDLAVSFEEPAEVEQVRVPQLTDAPAPSATGPGLLTAEGIISTEAPPDTRSGIAAAALRALLGEAEECARRGKLKEAVVLYGDVLEHDPEHLVAWLGRGRCLVDLSDYAAAMSDFTRAEDVAPDDPMPPYEMGNLFFARKEYSKSIGFYDAALQSDPNHALSLARRGAAHLHRKDFNEALADLQKAEKLDPGIPGLGRQVQQAKKKGAR